MYFVYVLATERLVLRTWTDADLAPFAALNADPEVMAFFPGTLDHTSSAELMARIRGHFEVHGFGMWAVERQGVFIGFAGLAVPQFNAHFTPCVEIGWRLAREYWGHGYATEAALAALRYGFESLGLDEIVSFTVPNNQRSRRVMEKLGMSMDGTFAHPRLPVEHPLSLHVLYRLRAQGR